MPHVRGSIMGIESWSQSKQNNCPEGHVAGPDVTTAFPSGATQTFKPASTTLVWLALFLRVSTSRIPSVTVALNASSGFVIASLTLSSSPRRTSGEGTVAR